MSALKLLVLSNPAAPYLRLLEELPDDTHLLVGDRKEMFTEAASSADAVLCGINQGPLLRDLWPSLKAVRWVHSFSAGVEGVLFPDLVSSPVPLTNARGVFARSLGEYAIASCLFFAKDFRRMLRSQAEGKWDSYDLEELTGKILGIVGYGEIGRAAAIRAKAMGMKVYVVRRRPELAEVDPLVDRVYAVAQRGDLMADSDYVLAAAPLTPQTRGLIGERELRRMKPTGVIMNLGRGPVIDEAALIKVLEEGTIRGAALDVFDEEPLKDGHPFYRLENVLLSAHCADHTPGWVEEAMQFFIDNFQRFYRNEPLENVVDKVHGY